MKKYLMMGAVVVAACAVFTSCSKEENLYDENAAANQVVAKYDAAFIQAFGQPAANQEWGFGKSASATRGITTRAIQSAFNFPGDADRSKFLADVPEGVEMLPEGGLAKANNFIDGTFTNKVNVWGDNNNGGTLYVKGDCDFSSRDFYFAGNSELYLVEGATLTLNASNAGNLQQNTKIYIASGAKLIAKGELKLNNGLQIYNHGTIEATNLSTNNTSVLYNVGTVTVTAKISVENTLSVVVNDGTITATDLNTAGSGKFQNNGNITISGSTVVNSNNNTWVNNGQWHTGYFIYNAASDDVINNCRLTVDEDFNINLGDNPGNGNFKMDAGSGVVTRNFNGGGNWSGTFAGNWNAKEGGPFFIYMGAGSVFKVTETATMNATKANYGIYGPESGDYAVFQANEIKAGKANQGYEVTYGGNLYVAAESHFANGFSGSYPYIDYKGNAKVFAPGFEDGLPAVTIEETECNPGFNGGGETTNPAIRVFVEDLSAGDNEDFDFNDAVFDAEYISETQAKITLWAAGGSLPLQICSKDGATYGGGFEVHAAFGVNVKCMVNTHAYPVIKDVAGYYSEDEKQPFTTTITLPENIGTLLGLSADDAKFDKENFAWSVKNLIRLEVQKDKWYELTATKGKPACKIAGPTTADATQTNWGIRWMLERHDIKGGYGNFKNYVNSGYPTDWWSANVNNAELYSKNHEPKGFTVECDEAAPHKK